MSDNPTTRSSKVDEFLEQLEFLIDTSDESMFDEGHLQLNNSRWYVHLVHDGTDARHAKDTMLALLYQRRELLKKVLLADKTNEFIETINDLSLWLHPRGFRVALTGKTFWSKIQLWWMGVRGIVGAE